MILNRRNLFPEMAKTYTSCNWVKSRITEEEMNNHVATGALAKKEDIHWRAPGDEVLPQPKNGEVTVFTDHLDRGFSPPSSIFFVMHFISSNCTLKTSNPTPCLTFAIFKYSVKPIFKRNPRLIYSGISII